MNPSISKNNFFYRLAVFGGHREYRQPTLCSLIGHALWGFVGAMSIAALISIVLFALIIFPCLELWFWTQQGLEPNWFHMGFPMIAASVVTLTGLFGSGPAEAVFGSIRDRFCVYIHVRAE